MPDSRGEAWGEHRCEHPELYAPDMSGLELDDDLDIEESDDNDEQEEEYS